MKRGKRKDRSSITDRRYESVIKRLDLDKGKPSRKRFIVIQIDSLAFETFESFMHKGACRNMRKLLTKEGYHVQKWNCGVPSGTPHVQAGIMYGYNSDIPGFRCMDKEKHLPLSCGNPAHVSYMEKRFFARKRGILEGGSSYSNHWSGGAEHSIFTMSTVTKKKRLKRLKESDLWLFLFLYPRSIGRVIYYSMTEFFIEVGEAIAYPFIRLFRPKRAIFGFWFPFRRILMNSIMAELITLGVITDIKRGVPKIYINFIGYDDVAHLRGPRSAAAFFMVRAIDRRVKRICRKARDRYDVIVMSDHGMVDAVSFRSINRMTLSQFIQRCARVESFGLSSAFEGRLTVMRIIMNRTIDFLKYVSTPLRWIGTAAAKGMLRVLKPKKYRFVWDRNERIYVLDSCCLAGVYFSTSKHRMDKEEIDKKYPKLIDKLLRNKGIGIIMVKDKEDILVLGKGGSITIKTKGYEKQGADFLSQYGDEKLLIKQLRDYNKLKFVGDLVLFGNYVDGNMVSFTDHVGAHGGIGGNMTWPFFMTKKKIDLSKMTNARQLHRFFKEYD